MVAAIFVFLSFACVVVCHHIAKKRRARPVFWRAMGAVFGPLAIPFVFVAKPILRM